MRINRSIQLYPSEATVHLYWRCHNRESYLQDLQNKDLYMKCIEDALKYKNQYENCKIHAFCVMDNHYHNAISYRNGSSTLSNFARYSHSLFGARYNKKHKRSGKVAEGRPKTPLVQNDHHEMLLQFYIEANPIRARIRSLENLKFYIYSSYGFYAYGIHTKFSHLLHIPNWYRKLGKTPHERQKKYRKLFRQYLETYTNRMSTIFKKRFIGDLLWIKDTFLKVKAISQLKLQVVVQKKLFNPEIVPNSS